MQPSTFERFFRFDIVYQTQTVLCPEASKTRKVDDSYQNSSTITNTISSNLDWKSKIIGQCFQIKNCVSLCQNLALNQVIPGFNYKKFTNLKSFYNLFSTLGWGLRTSIKCSLCVVMSYSTRTLVVPISASHFLIMWIDKSEIRPCGDSSNIPRSVAINFFFSKTSICVKFKNFAMTQLPGGQYCHQVIYWPS